MIRTWLANIALVVVSVAVTLAVGEGIARLTIAPRTSGAGMGILHRHFRAEHGLGSGLLVQEADMAADTSGRPLFVFLGDSVTNGHGVKRGETFASRVGAALGARYAVRTLARNGANTQQELASLTAGLAVASAPIATVVHQYLGNDIGDWVALDIASALGPADRWLVGLAERSYLVDYLYQPVFLRALGDGPVMDLLDAYTDDALRERHFADVRRIWQRSHAAGASVLLLVFPMPMSREIHDLSVHRSVQPIIALFQETCRAGDAVIDVAALIAAHAHAASLEHWVVSRVDAHPSAALHALVAREIIAYGRSRHGVAIPCRRDGAAH